MLVVHDTTRLKDSNVPIALVIVLPLHHVVTVACSHFTRYFCVLVLTNDGSLSALIVWAKASES